MPKAETALEDLHRAAEEAIDEHGWAGATNEAIAEAAGVSRVTLYRRGIAREDLLAGAANAAAAEFREATLAPLTHSGTGQERLELLIEALFDLSDQHLALLAGLYDGPTALFHLGHSDANPSALTRLEYTAPFARVLKDGIADGTLKSENVEEDAELIFNTAGWTYIHYRRSHGWGRRRARAAVLRVTIAFVLPA